MSAPKRILISSVLRPSSPSPVPRCFVHSSMHGHGRPVPMSGNDNVPSDNGNKSSSFATARETRVLSELAASAHTLESISQLLDQIAVLTGDPEEEASSSGVAGGVGGKKKRPAGLESIAAKQMALMEELGQWGKLLDSASTFSGGSAGNR